MYDSDNRYQFKQFGAKIAATNYYNQFHRIVRIEFNGKFFDFKYLGGAEVPHPKRHVAVVATHDDAINDYGIDEERLNFLPGLLDEEGTLADLPLGFVYVIPLNQSSSSTNANSGGSTFSISKISMLDLEKVAMALTPPTNKDYTSSNAKNQQSATEGQEDLGDKNVGIFINTDGAILIKSAGGSIALGEEGVYIAGSVGWESSEHQREWMADNFLQRFIPSTIPTGAVAIPELPNMAKFVQIAEGGKKVRDVVSKLGKIKDLVG